MDNMNGVLLNIQRILQVPKSRLKDGVQKQVAMNTH